jgi:hypothetical protein
LWIVIGLVGLVWAIDAGFDWDWEMPAVTLPVFVLGACALAGRGNSPRMRPRTELLLRVGVALIAIAAAITASRIAISGAELGRSVTAFNKGNCPMATADSHASISAISSRPEPYMILGYCDILTGSTRAAVAEMSEAVNRDPQNWLPYYGLAVADGAAGRDPHSAVHQAQLLNPQEPIVQRLAISFRGHNPTRWQQAADPPQTMPVSMEQ